MAGTLNPPGLARFRELFSGEVVLPGDPSYDQARVVWNAISDRRPALIARCSSVEDVVSAIRYARDQELTVAVRGGGHSVAGFATCDDGMVIDLSRMRKVVVDPARRWARAEGGAHLSQLDQAAQAHGLVCPVGVVGHTGVAGLTLGGGMGRLQRKFGLTVDNLVRVDLVTAEGELIRASEQENADLFWGLRGAGANFGVATAFEFRLHPMDATIFQGFCAYPIERSQEMAAHVREFVATHDEVHVAVAFTRAGDEPPFPAGGAGRPVFMVGATHTGSVEEAERNLRVLRGPGSLVDTFGPKSYLAVQGMADETMAWGQRFYTKSGFLPDFSEGVVDVCVAEVESIPPGAEISLWAQGGALGRVSNDAMAFTGRDAQFNISAELSWTDQAHDAERMAWGRKAMAAVKPFMTTGRYVNDVVEAGTDGAQIYGKAKYDRLVGLKRKYDPDNFFRLNQNIRP
ncbi:MAG: FAD-binding oxidoreductase [Candidatus Dormibacteraeota bacterium]|nr:FAD-binding oxidoreductase [Candidatus Dormibacteraeota bacterium]